MKVYDITGKEIGTLVNEEKQAGTYELTWKAGNLPSGVYIYRLQAGEFVGIKKMLLLK
ncbi:T9SS type A sorting domain-containing protein [Clostridium sp.]|uniref:T9SS type A sorting domain-containing protein n=1 Tax=Clostridium sp. TaxID=1506 RepID=UPI0037BF634A